ncbi:MAG: acyltransferase family protein [Candidatus Thorarchaeota archaeon]
MSDQESLSALEEIDVELGYDKEQKKPYYFQLDVLKAIAIAFVVMDHSLTWEIKSAMGATLWERLSIPFFLIVMGFNLGYSSKFSGATSLRELYSKSYFKRKIERYVLPFAVLYMASFLVGIITGLISFNLYTLLGVLPFWGPGNWFIALLFGSIVVFPFIYWLFKKQPVLTLVLCFLAEIVVQAILFIWFPFPASGQYPPLEGFIVSALRVSVFFYLPAVSLGLWFSEGYDIRVKRNWFMFLYIPISYFFMIDYMTRFFSDMPNAFGQTILWIQDFIRGDYTILFYGYAGMLFIVAMVYLPQQANGRIQKFVQQIGRASYHILLFQIFYMSLVYFAVSIDAATHHFIPDFAAILGWPTELIYIPFYLINLTICFAGGLLWYRTENKAAKNGKPWWQHGWMKRTAFLFGAIVSIFMLGVSLTLIAEFMSFNEWTRQPGSLFALDEITGLGFMASFIVILFWIGLCMMFIFKAFPMGDDDIPL